MPNWKSYESSVRLLSAILAAHPELKLNYQEISRCFGGDSTRSAIDNRFRGIKIDAKKIREALDSGIDPSTVGVGATNGGCGSKDIGDRYGGDCTKSAIENRLRVIKSDAKRINEAFARGVDPITLTVGVKEVSKYFGSDGPDSTIKSQVKKIKAHVNRVKIAVDKGIDPLTVEVVVGWAISTHFGGGCTHRAVESKMLKLKNTTVKSIREAVASGIDPITVHVDAKCSRDDFYYVQISVMGLYRYIFLISRVLETLVKASNSGAEVSKYYGDSTAVALEHRFRPIKQLAKDLRAGIADKLDDGTTAKAVSSRIDRVKKESAAGKIGASKAPRTPSKIKSKKTGLVSPSDGSENQDDDDEDEEDMPAFKSPTSGKKSSMNRTQTGRITKELPTRKVGHNRHHADFDELSLENDDDDELMEVQQEDFMSAKRKSNANAAHNGADVYASNGRSEYYDIDVYASPYGMGHPVSPRGISGNGTNGYQQPSFVEEADNYEY